MNKELKQFWKYLITTPSERRSFTYCCLRIIIVLAIFFFVLLPLLLLFGLVVLSFPWLFAIGIFCAIGFSCISFLCGLIIKKIRHQSWNASSWVFRILVAFWAWAFIFPISFAPLTNWTLLKNNTEHLQVPLDMPNGIAIDSTGRVYLSVRSFQRIQVYDKNGIFIKGWPASISHEGSNYRFFVDEQDRLHVLSNFSHAVYDTNGVLLSINELYDSERHKDYAANNPRLAKDHDGNIFEFKDKSSEESFYSLFSKVIKTTPDGQQSIFITDPLPLWLIKRIFPAFGFMMLSMIPGGFFGWLAKKAKKPQLSPTETKIGLGFFLSVLFAKITKRKVDFNKYLPADSSKTDTLCEASEQPLENIPVGESEPLLVLSSVFCPVITRSQTRFLQVFLLVWGTGFLGGLSYIALKELGFSISPKPYFIIFGCLWFLVIRKLSYLLKKFCHDKTKYCFYSDRLECDDLISFGVCRKVQYREIRNVEFQQIWGQKKRGLGNITIILRQSKANEDNDNEIELYNIPEAKEAFDKIRSLIT